MYGLLKYPNPFVERITSSYTVRLLLFDFFYGIFLSQQIYSKHVHIVFFSDNKSTVQNLQEQDVLLTSSIIHFASNMQHVQIKRRDERVHLAF
jgi:hypothetical protein